jgi:hypothetical protein
MTPEEHAAILARDGVCFLFAMDPQHVCRDMWGNEHLPTDLTKLTVDHVKPAPMMGQRGKEGVAMCFAGNVGVPSRAVRAAERAYLAAKEATNG